MFFVPFSGLVSLRRSCAPSWVFLITRRPITGVASNWSTKFANARFYALWTYGLGLANVPTLSQLRTAPAVAMMLNHLRRMRDVILWPRLCLICPPVSFRYAVALRLLLDRWLLDSMCSWRIISFGHSSTVHNLETDYQWRRLCFSICRKQSWCSYQWFSDPHCSSKSWERINRAIYCSWTFLSFLFNIASVIVSVL